MKSKIAVIIFCLTLAFMTTGCVNKEKLNKSLSATSSAVETEAVDGVTPETSGSVVMVSSMETLPLMLALTDGMSYEASCVGKEAAVEAVHQKTAQLALYEGYIDGESGLQEIIAYESVALIVNQASDLEDVSPEEVRAFFCGETDQIQGKTFERVVTSQGSPSRSLFEDFFQVKEDQNGILRSLIPDSASVFETDLEVSEFVSQNPSAIGMVLLGNTNGQVKPLKLSGVTPELKTLLDQTYPVSNPIMLMADASNETVFKSFIDLIQSENGQAAMIKTGFTPTVQK